ncbi:hypothetical protein CKM354_000468900 [Cercospora kikuchii]|uniref:Thioesterase domain-containing protein n=1 Tax=Cercospora kikuchii TaxID=84275 RepID=A0A9P3CMZ5_9PEZI|nr:uncharacterized protein CKM354_000468900 [Cercospora kikuchii]GIZ41383.1 hypothetical protein CKM354_000468900 [Cercospora kikuchii]
MASEEQLDNIFRIIAEAVSVEPEELQDYETWKYHGLAGLLATATASDIRQQVKVEVSDNVFEAYPTVGGFKKHLQGDSSTTNGSHDLPKPDDPWQDIAKPKVPLSIVLQGSPSNAATVVFLFPDGSGAGTSYGTLPKIAEDVCLIGLNSPFLRQAQNFTCSIERMARLWVDEVRKLQPKNKPFVLGGWSAGGYYSYEVAKLLTAAGEKVDRLILIDSPCRLQYEALPEQVVAELTRKGLMGASGQKKAPEWLVQHFTSTVISVDRYMPTTLPSQHVPSKVDFIWVKEGLVKSVAESGLEVDLNIKVTRFLLEPRGNLRTEGWEKLLPGARYFFNYMTGNHFQITQPPHSDSLGTILGQVLKT